MTAEDIEFVTIDNPQGNKVVVSPASPGSTEAGDAPYAPGFLKTARHPIICMCHMGFKALALLSFVFGSFIFGGFKGDYVCTFIITTILLSIDFWVVKNITGRLLVGMRWWHKVNEDGSEEWIYEAHTDERVINTTDKAVFWITLYSWPIMWGLLLLLYLVKVQIEWMLLVGIGFALGAANLIGYWNCSKEAKSRMQQWASASTFLRTALGRFF